jgi:hypothetical protein
MCVKKPRACVKDVCVDVKKIRVRVKKARSGVKSVVGWARGVGVVEKVLAGRAWGG